jgi:uncharacterized protein YndB with AHSA1/START domain
MTTATLQSDLGNIVVDEVLPHDAALIWKTLTDGEMIGRWMMPPAGFKPVVGTEFTFKTTPAGAWDGTIRCKVLEVLHTRRLAYEWKGGDEGNIGYGSKLDTIVSFTLTPVDGGTRVQMVHSGFVMPKNEVARKNMGDGWGKVISRLGEAVAGDA